MPGLAHSLYRFVAEILAGVSALLAVTVEDLDRQAAHGEQRRDGSVDNLSQASKSIAP